MPATLLSNGSLRILTAPVFTPLLYPSRYKVAKGGRGAGRSHFFAEAIVEKCLANPGTSVACIREVQKSLRFSAKRVIEKKIRDFGVADQFGMMDAETRTPGGGIIIYQGMQNHTAESVQSLEDFDVAWAEEARSLSQRSLDLLRPTIRKPGSELWFSYNPKHAKDPVDKFFAEMFPGYDKTVTQSGFNKDANAAFVHSNWYDNPWFPPDLRKEKDYDLRRDPDKYQHTWLGGYQRRSEASVFRNWKVQEFETPANARFYFGADWGFSVDPTVLIRSFFGHLLSDGTVKADDNGRTLFFDYEAYEIGCEIDQIPALFAGDDTIHTPGSPLAWTNHKKRPGIPGAMKWVITADSQRPDTISYLSKRGFRIEPAVKGKGSVEEGVEFLKTFDTVIHPRCIHTADEYSSYSYEVDPDTDEVLPWLADEDNHVIDSARYGIEKKRRAGISMTDYL